MKNNLRNIVTMLSTLLFGTCAFAMDDAGAMASMSYGWYAIAAALAIGLPAIGGTLGQGKAAAAALEGIARNPGASGKILVPMILGMALIESLVLFGLIIAFMLAAKIA